jgi:glc operon protein GlcG
MLAMSRDHSPDTVPAHSISFDPARRVLDAAVHGAPRLSLKIAEDKAYSVASFGGGLPLLIRGEVVGAIGVSGGTDKEDREIAQAGSDSLD